MTQLKGHSIEKVKSYSESVKFAVSKSVRRGLKLLAI